jgi:hypothetical protein
VELGEVGLKARNVRAISLVQGLVVDGFVIRLDVELGFERQEIKRNVFILMAFDVIE